MKNIFYKIYVDIFTNHGNELCALPYLILHELLQLSKSRGNLPGEDVTMLWELPEITSGRRVSTNFYLDNDESVDGYFFRIEYLIDGSGDWNDIVPDDPDYNGRVNSEGTPNQTIGFTLQSLTLQQDPGDYTCYHASFPNNPQWGSVQVLFIYGEKVLALLDCQWSYCRHTGDRRRRPSMKHVFSEAIDRINVKICGKVAISCPPYLQPIFVSFLFEILMIVFFLFAVTVDISNVTLPTVMILFQASFSNYSQ